MKESYFARGYGAMNRRNQLFLKEVAKKYGISLVESMIITYIAKNEGLSQEQIAFKLTVDKAVIAKSVKLLEIKGFIRREADESDLRFKRVFPTKEGRELNAALCRYTQVWSNKLLEDLTLEESKLAFTLLSRMANATESISISAFIAENFDDAEG